MFDLLGLRYIFSIVGKIDKSDIKRTMAKINASWRFLDASVRVKDIRCNSFMTLSGCHCLSTPTQDCFIAPESAYLFEQAANCLQTANREFGSSETRCILLQDVLESESENDNDDDDADSGRRVLPSDTVYDVRHIRSGDFVPHPPNDDDFYKTVLTELRYMTMTYSVLIFLVEKGRIAADGDARVDKQYVDRIRTLGAVAWNDTAYRQHVIAPTYSFADAFLAAMQADVLIGSGSSLPAVASLVSGIPFFFNHVPKHGYNHGAEMTADSVEMDANGTVIDSRRRHGEQVYRRVRSSRRTACRGVKMRSL